MDIDINNFSQRGDWDDVADHGRRITHYLSSFEREESQLDPIEYEDEVQAWERWRPKRGEGIEDVRPRTARMEGNNILESMLFQNMMNVTPCYFDTNLVSAELKTPSPFRQEHVFDVHVHEDDVAECVQEQLTAPSGL